jgi:hypothetical protein
MSNTISSFNGGLFSSYLVGRPELEKYHNALQQLSNYHLMPYGALQNRAGTYYIADESTTDMRLITFQFNISQSYVLVFFNNKIKVILNDEVVGSGGVAGAFNEGFSNGFSVDLSEYFIPSPWTNEQLFDIQFVQVADTMWLVHPEVPPQKLVRYADDSWTLTEIDYDRGPFLPYNITSTTIVPSATTGTGITLTSSEDLFTADDIGRTVEIKQIRTDSTTTATAASYSPWIKVKGNWDFATRGTWTGTAQIWRRVGDSGTGAVFRSFLASDDNNFIADGEEEEDNIQMRVFGRPSCTATLTVDDFYVYGVAKITAFTDAKNVTADVLTDFDNTNAVTEWAFNSFSDASGYPTAIGLYSERMCIGGTLAQPNTVFLSKLDQWENYQSSNNNLDAMSFKLNTSENIQWLQEQGDLIIGTSGEEYKLGPDQPDKPLGGNNVKAITEGAEGSSALQAITVADVLVFLTRDGKRVKTIGYNFEADKLKARDLNSLAGTEITESKIRQIGYRQNPYSEIYFQLNNGKVAIMTFDQDQNIYGWTLFETDGLIKSTTIIKDVDGNDDVYFAVERVIGGVKDMMIERMVDRDFQNQKDWFFVDSGQTDILATDTNIITGLQHLEGETVKVVVDGGIHADRVVSAGSITLDKVYPTGSIVHTGLGYRSYAQPMSLDSSDGVNSTMAKWKKQNKLSVKVRNTIGLSAGQSLEELEPMRVNQTDDKFGLPLEAYTGIYEIVIDGSHELEYAPFFVQDLPLAQEILGYISPINIGG